MFTITKRFEFSASHQLTHLAARYPDHQCARLHGHNYVVEVELQADTTNADGFVRDYGLLAPLKTYIDTQLDHRHLNDVLGSSEATTAEHLARHLFELFLSRVPELRAVRVSETPKTTAEWRAAGTHDGMLGALEDANRVLVSAPANAPSAELPRDFASAFGALALAADVRRARRPALTPTGR